MNRHISPQQSFCHYFNQTLCHSCHWISKPLQEQLRLKEEILRKNLEFFDEIYLEESVCSQSIGFRTRAKMNVTGTVDHPKIGLIGKEPEFDLGQDLTECPIHHPKINEVLQSLPTYIQKYHLTPYRIKEQKGELKGLILFYSPTMDQMYLRFVLRSKECSFRIKKFTDELLEKFSFLKCISCNIQPIPHAVLEGKEEIYLTDTKYIQHKIESTILTISPQAFVQTNSDCAEKLYQTAAMWISEIKPEKMCDLYCGQGAFSFLASKDVKNILAMELNENAIECAQISKKNNNIKNCEFITINARDALEKTLGFNPDLILVNPPRSGLAQSIECIEKIRPKNFIYSSCNCETLALDLKKIAPFYQVKKTKIFDLFPHTSHFETLMLLELK